MKHHAKLFVRRILGRYLIPKSGFWFVDIPRTSSSSLRAELGRKYGFAHAKTNRDNTAYAARQLFHGHQTALAMRTLLGHKIWDGLYTFSLVRNPWERLASLYWYEIKAGNLPETKTFKEFIREKDSHPSPYRPFRDSVNWPCQMDHLIDEDGKVLVKFIGRYENRAEDIKVIAEALNYPELGKIWIQKAAPPSVHYSTYYDEETRDIVARLCAKDIDHLGYRFEEGE